MRHTNIIGLRELREKTEEYVRRVQKGDSFIVVRRSKPVFKIVPPDDESEWETVVDFTKIRKRGVPIDEVMDAIKKMK